MSIDLLVIEELTASEALWQQSPDSIRREAVAMVAAVTQDLASIPGLQSAVLLSPASSASPLLRQLLPQKTLRCLAENGPAAWLELPNVPATAIHNLLIVAPEFDDLLVTTLQAAQNGPLGHVNRLNLPPQLAAVFADKFATARWLQQRNLPTPRTNLATDDDFRKLAADSLPPKTRQDCHGVLKPRFGAGCEHVHLIPHSPITQMHFDESKHAPWVLQQRIPGRAFSVSLIGQGNLAPALILPPGRQRISRSPSGTLQYSGGQFPCHRDLAAVVEIAAKAFRDALGPFNGWLGLDLVVEYSPSQPPKATIIEVNPRLCTSYIGYRQLTTDNLALRMLTPHNHAPIRWNLAAVHFNTTPSANQCG